MDALPEAELPGIDGRISVSAAGFFAASAILWNGSPAPAGTGRGTVLLPRLGGGTATARVASGLFDLTPVVEVDGVKHPVGPAVPAWLGAIALLPMGLLFAGGAIGGLLGGLAVTVNQRVVRGSSSAPLNVVTMFGVGLGALIIMVVAATAIRSAIGQ